MALIDLKNSLVASYNLDGNSVDNKNANNGTDTAITYNSSNGKIIQGAGFNGTTSFISIPNNSVFNFGNGISDVPFTVEGWFYFNSVSGVRELINKRSGTAAGDEWQLISNGNVITLGIISLTGSMSISTGAVLSIGNWYHIVATYNASGINTGMNLHINNSLQLVTRATSGTYTKMPTGTNIVAIGKASWASSFYFNGKADIIRIYKGYEANASDVNFLYNSSVGCQYPFNSSNFFQIM